MVKEVVMISEDSEEDIDMLLLDRRDNNEASAASAAASLSKLESLKFLRVLLVEFDDCTRSIISALLRKSGYRVVSVPDGLKAWELLKGKSHTIDLVLAEVELPSICGFSLLSMIMEDETFRNIPVIMMSPHDAVNIVFKCMLRGAADFLVKPVRKNELRNLWQHVWRRKSVSSSLDRTLSQQNEAIDESSSTKDSTHCVASSKENRECSEKQSDAHSSCVKEGLEDVDVDIASTQNLFHQSTYTIPEEKHADTFHVNDGHVVPTREAMDLIGSFNNQLNQYNTQFQEVNNTSNIDCDLNRMVNGCSSTPRLELSLKRSHFSDFEVQGVADIRPLKRSTASAFSRYHHQNLQSPAGSESKDQANHKAEALQHRVISVPIPVRTQIVDGVHIGYGSAWPQLFYTPLGPSSLQTPNSVAQQEPTFQVFQSDQSNTDVHEYKQYNHKTADKTIYKQRHNVKSFDDSRHVASAAAPSYTSSLCNSSSSDFNSSGCGSVCDGSNGNETAATIVRPATAGRCGSDVGVVMADTSKGTDTNSQTQREAALNKFRLKRKDRCFEKKVRYQSRKKLAEQRPRVKGQFVRQIVG
ncbi:hypothetical protein ACHQM5_000009 [Ranunculus cassubicifolius]